MMHKSLSLLASLLLLGASLLLPLAPGAAQEEALAQTYVSPNAGALTLQYPADFSVREGEDGIFFSNNPAVPSIDALGEGELLVGLVDPLVMESALNLGVGASPQTLMVGLQSLFVPLSFTVTPELVGEDLYLSARSEESEGLEVWLLARTSSEGIAGLVAVGSADVLEAHAATLGAMAESLHYAEPLLSQARPAELGESFSTANELLSFQVPVGWTASASGSGSFHTLQDPAGNQYQILIIQPQLPLYEGPRIPRGADARQFLEAFLLGDGTVQDRAFLQVLRDGEDLAALRIESPSSEAVVAARLLEPEVYALLTPANQELFGRPANGLIGSLYADVPTLLALLESVRYDNPFQQLGNFYGYFPAELSSANPDADTLVVASSEAAVAAALAGEVPAATDAYLRVLGPAAVEEAFGFGPEASVQALAEALAADDLLAIRQLIPDAERVRLSSGLSSNTSNTILRVFRSGGDTVRVNLDQMPEGLLLSFFLLGPDAELGLLESTRRSLQYLPPLPE